jgi:hypothetical protein
VLAPCRHRHARLAPPRPSATRHLPDVPICL